MEFGAVAPSRYELGQEEKRRENGGYEGRYMSQRTGRQASPEESLGLQSIGFRACVKQRRNREVDETLTTDSRGSCRG